MSRNPQPSCLLFWAKGRTRAILCMENSPTLSTKYSPRPLQQRHCPAPMSPATGHISYTPSRPLLASPTHKILIPVLGGIGSCPQAGKTSPTVPRPRFSTFRSIPAWLSITDSLGEPANPARTKGWRRLPLHRPTRIRGSTTLAAGAHVGHVMLHHSRSYKLPESLKHHLSHPTITNTVALFSCSRAILPSFLKLKTSKPV